MPMTKRQRDRLNADRAQSARISSIEQMVEQFIPVELREYIRFEPNEQGQLRIVASEPFAFDTATRQYRLAQPGEKAAFPVLSPSAFESYYKTPTEAIRFEGREPFRTAFGNFATSAIFPTAQRQWESIDSYGSNPDNPTGSIGNKVLDYGGDATQAIGRAAPILLRYSKRGPVAKALMGAAMSGGGRAAHSALSEGRDESYNGADAIGIGINAAGGAATGLAGALVHGETPEVREPPKNSNADVANEIRRSIGLQKDYPISTSDITNVVKALRSKDNGRLWTAKRWIQEPYLSFTKQHGNEPVEFDKMPIPRSQKLGRPLSRSGRDGGYTLDDWAPTLKTVLGDDLFNSLYGSGAIQDAIPTLNRAYIDPHSELGRAWFGVSPRSRSATAHAAEDVPFLLYPDDNEKKSNSLVARKHRYSTFSDDPVERVVGYLDQQLAHLKDPSLDAQYRKRLEAAAERRAAAKPTAGNSNAPLISIPKWESMQKEGKVIKKAKPASSKLAKAASAVLQGVFTLGQPILDWYRLNKSEAPNAK